MLDFENTIEEREAFLAMKGSLSNRGCYLDAKGRPLLNLKSFLDVTRFICLDCGTTHAKAEEHQIVERLKSNKRVLRPLCGICYSVRGGSQ
jgi:hypothetical protein